jgi:hypothetical protein
VTATDIDVLALAGGRYGIIDVPCPLCGPSCSTPAKGRQRKLRIWRDERGFARFCCARCGHSGYQRDEHLSKATHVSLLPSARNADQVERRHDTARWLWSLRQPIAGTMAEHYLRSRGIICPLPPTLAFLPARRNYGPALIAAFGLADEPEPGILGTPVNVDAVHRTFLDRDGGKADIERPKRSLGSHAGRPIVLAPVNDGLGLAITEGIEDALSVHQATGLGAWAAGGAHFMPKLAGVVPACVGVVTIYAHDDQAGQDGVRQLAEALIDRGGLEVYVEGLAS